MQPPLPIDLPDGRPLLPGFRLKKLEMLNWGTFHRKVERLTPDGGWTMLVGVNGTGKSTAADALRTLLVHPSKLTYNDASGDHKLRISRKDRTRRTYVRGAYGASSQEDSISAIPQYLRNEGEQSMLLALFENRCTGAEITLAEILWELNEQIDQIYVIARSAKNIKEHLTGLGTSRELKKELKKRGFECFDSFAGYEERFRGLLGIPGAGALDVFNKTIGVKEVIDINQFVHDHMLEPSNAMEFIENHLKPHYTELLKCWQAMQKAEAQSNQLAPIVEQFQMFAEAEQAKCHFELLKQATPRFFEEKELSLRMAYDEDLEINISGLNKTKCGLEAEQELDENTSRSLEIAICTDQVGQRLRDIEREIDDALRLRDSKKKTLEKIGENLLLLNQPATPETEADFTKLRHKLLIDKGPLEGNLQAHRQKQNELFVTKSKAEEERESVKKELQSVRQNRVLIPSHLLEIRDAICRTTGIPAKELPFGGELIEVKAEFKEWTGAIERLLRGLGVSLLVPESRYLEVTKYINATHLGTRLTFFRVPSAVPAPTSDLLNDPGRVPARLNFLQNHELISWVQTEVTRRYGHLCCANVQELNQTDYGITCEGLIRGGARHEKDDTFRVTDRSRYVLGWNIQTKVSALIEELQSVEKKISDHDRRCQQVAENIKTCSAKLSALMAILAVEDFDEINIRPQLIQLEELTAEQQQLQNSSDKIRSLKKQLDEAKERIKERKPRLTKLEHEIGAELDKQKTNRTKVSTLRQELGDARVDETCANELESYRQNRTVTLDNIYDVRRFVMTKIEDRLSEQDSKMRRATESLLPAMDRFLRDYPEETANLAPNIDSGPGFAELKRQIDKDQLPTHKARFSSFLNQSLIMDLAAFNTKLSQHEQQIRFRIDAVNKALRNIEFSAGTYVQVVVANSRSDEIKTFRAELRNCLRGSIMPKPEDQNSIFEDIKKLISKFDQNRDWTTRVTDGRNWLEYAVREVNQKDGSEAKYYAGSTGRSGGQKTKIAFTILASAIMAQYGLMGETDDMNRFRLVVVDEAFARTDEENSQRALDLFKKLGLQLIVINPFDAKARIVEDYVDSFHLISVSEEISHLQRATRVQYEEARKVA